METMLTEYIKKDNRKVGMLVAIKNKIPMCDYVTIGFSLCNPKDKFNKEKALDLALVRAKTFNNEIPPSIIPQLTIFIDRITRYYKDVPSENIPAINSKKVYILN